MRHIVLNKLAAAALLLSATAATAQTAPAAQQGPQNAAIKGMNENNSSAPVAGANSFTQDQAIKQIEAKGYTQVAGLKLDDKGVWRGTAMKGGAAVPVSVDYQGNVN